jgi:cytoskeletal protein CcmA (bactofilin family)
LRKERALALKGNPSESSSTELNFLGGGTVVDGTIKSENSVRIDGMLKGKLVCKKTLTVGVNGEIEGEIEAKNAIIGGKINGKIKVAEKLVLEAKSTLIGELKAGKLLIDEGAVFEGTSKMGIKEQVSMPPKPIEDFKKPA